MWEIPASQLIYHPGKQFPNELLVAVTTFSSPVMIISQFMAALRAKHADRDWQTLTQQTETEGHQCGRSSSPLSQINVVTRGPILDQKLTGSWKEQRLLQHNYLTECRCLPEAVLHGPDAFFFCCMFLIGSHSVMVSELLWINKPALTCFYVYLALSHAII